MIKTVELTGTEMKVEGLEGQNTVIINNGNGKLYASAYPNVAAGVDNVIEIPVGAHDGLNDTRGTVYLLGTGRVELRGTDYPVNFRQPSSSALSGGGGEECTGTQAISGKFEYGEFGVIRSIFIEGTDYSDLQSKMMVTLANETGWELQSDGVTVLKDGDVGFAPYYYDSTTYGVRMVTNARAQLDKSKCFGSASKQCYMDIVKTKNGTVTFGFRSVSDDHPRLQFVVTKNAAGDNAIVWTYEGIYWALKDDTYYHNLSEATFVARRIYPTVEYMTALNPFPDIENGGFFQDLYYFLLSPRYSLDGVVGNRDWRSGDQIIVNDRHFVIVFNNMYSYDQAILALLVE